MPSLTDRLLALADRMAAAKMSDGTLFLCLTGAEQLLSLLGLPVDGLAGVLPHTDTRSAWLERCAGFHRLAPLRDRFTKSHATMVADGPFAKLTDLGAWHQWAAKGEVAS